MSNCLIYILCIAVTVILLIIVFFTFVPVIFLLHYGTFAVVCLMLKMHSRKRSGVSLSENVYGLKDLSILVSKAFASHGWLRVYFSLPFCAFGDFASQALLFSFENVG